MLLNNMYKCRGIRKRFSYRLANEGLPNINYMIGQCRRLNICKEDLIALLNNTDPTKPPPLTTLSTETQEHVKDLGMFFDLLCFAKRIDILQS